MDDLLALGRKSLAAQPFNTLVHAELAAFSEERTELHLPITESLKQQHGFVHGGILSYLADNALTFMAGAVLKSNAVTSEMKINYLRPAQGSRLIARAHLVYAGRTQAVCRCDVFVVKDGEEKLCAAAQGTIVKLNDQK